MERNILRLIDANANRAREGLRVIEEAARMLRDDTILTESLKKARHRVTELVSALPVSAPELLAARNASGDVGTRTHTAVETQRESLAVVLICNFKRAQESCRVLEEYTKLMDATIGEGFKHLRFTLYTLEQKVLALEGDAGATA